MVERFGIITNCTARKRALEPIARLGASELLGGATKVAARWSRAIAATSVSTTAGKLYLGRAMSESKAIAAQLAGSLHIVSAGLGLAAEDDRVPNYDITVATRDGSLTPALARAGSSTADWWEELNARKGTPMPLSRLINCRHDTAFLLALPSAYVEMLSRDLEKIQDGALERLYIFTSSMGRRLASERLLHCILPYDERLEGHPDYAGTRSDFPQRAMSHFVEQLSGHQLTRAYATQTVQEHLSSLQKPTIPQRVRKSDSEIVMLLRARWHEHAGNSSRLLRYLRDTEVVACEQGRFGRLWREVKAELQ